MYWLHSSKCRMNDGHLTLIRLGGGGHDGPPPLDISHDYSATREVLAATLYDNFLSSFPHILTPNLWRPGVRFRSYVTLCTCTSDRKWLQNVILCTKSMQIEFSQLVHINMHIFTLNCWNILVFDLLCFKKCLPQISVKKTTKNKRSKKQKYIRNSQNNKIHKKLILIP